MTAFPLPSRWRCTDCSFPCFWPFSHLFFLPEGRPFLTSENFSRPRASGTIATSIGSRTISPSSILLTGKSTRLTITAGNWSASTSPMVRPPPDICGRNSSTALSGRGLMGRLPARVATSSMRLAGYTTPAMSGTMLATGSALRERSLSATPPGWQTRHGLLIWCTPTGNFLRTSFLT